MQSPPSPPGRASAPSTLRRIRQGRICRNLHQSTCQTNSSQMGQGSSTPQQQGAPSQQADGGERESSPGEGTEGGGNDNEAQQEPDQDCPFSRRRTSRLRNSITQLRGRLLRSGSTSVTPLARPIRSPDRTQSPIQSPRRQRVRFLSRSPSPTRYNEFLSGGLAGSARRPVSPPITLPPLISQNLQPSLDDEADTVMSDPLEPSPPPTPNIRATSADPPVLQEQSPSSRRSRLSRVRSSIQTTLPNLPNLLAEIGSSRLAGSSSRRNSQFRPEFLDPFDDDDRMDIGGQQSSSSAAQEPNARSSQPELPAIGDSNTIDLLENPRVRPGEDHAAMLSRVLSVAAAMTAASLVEGGEQPLTEAPDGAGNSADGSFESFLRALQNGRLPSEPGSDGSLSPLNFFRMFRFGAQTPSSSTDSDTPPTRMVPVIIVGIRSVTPRDSTTVDLAVPSPFIEQLANMSNTQPRGGSRTRYGTGNRRASMSAVGGEVHRLRRSPRPTSEILSSASEALNPTVNSSIDTSQGPTSPPSTPAEQGLAAFANGLLNSVANPLNSGSGDPRPNGDSPPATRGTRRPSTPQVPSPLGLASGESSTSSRSGTSSGQRRSGNEGTRSWIIYVLGGSYPENHPILTTPSLFTDVFFHFLFQSNYGEANIVIVANVRRYDALILPFGTRKTASSHCGRSRIGRWLVHGLQCPSACRGKAVSTDS